MASLADPLRRALYDYVAAQDHEVSRNEAAEAVGAQRQLAAFHLDRLVAAGLLAEERRKLSGRQGPGSGRPAKVYRRAERQRTVQLPPRDYEAAAHLLAEAVERAGADAALHAAAREAGERRGAAAARERGGAGPASAAELLAALAAMGYEPADGSAAGAVRLRNCPFHTLAGAYPPLACGMNLALLEGLVAGLGAEGVRPRLDPAPGRCCVVLSKNNED
nr:helix-turn-helix domain-containing protein [Allonocardiopsis opalescens]